MLSKKDDNINHFAPVFHQDNYTASISEYTQIGAEILRVTATDYDMLPPNNIVRYSLIIDHPDRDYFMIQERSGDIRLAKSLVGVTQDQFKMLVKATDLGSPSRFVFADLEIQITR